MHGLNNSAQRASRIEIKMNRSESVAQYAHEFAHLVGNQGGYAAYRRYMGNSGYCVVSGYSDNKFNEQFAEVFAAFVTEPSLFARSRPKKACQKAFNFFKNKFFRNGNRVKECM